MMDCFQFCFNSAFKFNLRRYTKVDRTPIDLPFTCDGCANYILTTRHNCGGCEAGPRGRRHRVCACVYGYSGTLRVNGHVYAVFQGISNGGQRVSNLRRSISQALATTI
jgi:hypothetical protein